MRNRHAKPATLLLILAAVSILTREAAAGLVWQQMSQSMTADMGAARATTTFGFHNDGSDAVQILAVTPSCSCLSATSSAESIAPGQTGEIGVTFRPTMDRLGTSNVWIAVASMSGATRKTELLRLNVQIRPAVTCDPPSLVWAKDEATASKTVSIIPVHPEQAPLSITRIDAGPDFNVAADATGTRVTVTPATTGRSGRARIRLTVRRADRSTVEAIVMAEVRP